MRLDGPDQIRPVRRGRRTPGDRLREALQEMTGGLGNIRRHQERPWASITFTGCRHTINMEFCGVQGVAAGETFVASLPDHEFTIVGQLAADANIISVDHIMLPEPQMVVDCEILLLEDV